MGYVESAHIDSIRGRYLVERTGNEKMPYKLTGKRGAVYYAMRQVRSSRGMGGGGVIVLTEPRYPLFIADTYGVIRRLSGSNKEWVSAEVLEQLADEAEGLTYSDYPQAVYEDIDPATYEIGDVLERRHGVE